MHKRHRLLIGALLLASTSALEARGGASAFVEDYTSAELHTRLASNCPVLLVFSGGTEATGPHIALGKHNLRVRAYAEAIARRMDDALVAPVLPFAPNSPELQRFPGTITLDDVTFSRVNEEVVRSMIASGFRSVALLSDHFNSQPILAEVASRLDAEFKPKGARVFFVSDGYAKARQQIEAELKRTGRVPGGHGGLWDTAETMAVRPAAVRPKEFRPGTVADDGNGDLDARGVSGDPRGATAEMGRRFAAIRIHLASEQLRGLLRSGTPCPPR